MIKLFVLTLLLGACAKNGDRGFQGEQGIPGESVVGPQGEAGKDGVDGTNGTDAIYQTSGQLGLYKEVGSYNGSNPVQMTCMLGESGGGIVVLRIRVKSGGLVEVLKAGSGITDLLYFPSNVEVFLYSTRGNGTYKASVEGGPSNTKACNPL